MTLYEELKESGAQIESHESDLYTPDTPEARELVKRHDATAGTFTSQIDGKPWLDIAFQYDPFWQERAAAKPPRTLAEIAQGHPALTYEASGYDEPNKADWTEADRAAFDEAESILREKVKGFKRFQNFTRSKSTGTIRARLQHAWDERFTGVGYFDIDDIDAA